MKMHQQTIDGLVNHLNKRESELGTFEFVEQDKDNLVFDLVRNEVSISSHIIDIQQGLIPQVEALYAERRKQS